MAKFKRLAIPLTAVVFGLILLLGAQLFVRPRLARLQAPPGQAEERFLAKLKSGDFCGARGPQFAALLNAQRAVLDASIKLNVKSLHLISLLSAAIAVFGCCGIYSVLRPKQKIDDDGPA